MNIKQREIKIPYDESDSIMEKIYKIRGITDLDEFLKPSLDNVNPPFLLGNCEKVADRIVEAINFGEKIGVYSDCDCDGVTSAAFMIRYLSNFTNNLVLISPERSEGHGVKEKNVDREIDLLIIVDSSTNEVEECEILSKDMDVVILDHHPKERDNEFAVIVNPQICDYPNKGLSGVGVCYQVGRMLDRILEVDYTESMHDIVALGMIGDMMDCQNLENRAIMHAGLKMMHDKESGNVGIYQALKVLKHEFLPNSQSISFYLAPLINSSIRLENIKLPLQLLLTDWEQEAKGIAKQMKKNNDKRKKEQKKLIEKIKEQYDMGGNFIFADVTSFGVDNNLCGLIANSLGNDYKKPAFIVSEIDGKFCGSARDGGAIDRLKDRIVKFSGVSAEGHNSAFGVSIEKDEKEQVFELLNELLENEPKPVVEYDLEVNYNQIDWNLCSDMQKINYIVGTNFPAIEVLVSGAMMDEFSFLGKEQNHMKGVILDEDWECVKFFINEDELSEISDMINLKMIGSLAVNSFYNFGKKRVIKKKQMVIKEFWE